MDTNSGRAPSGQALAVPVEPHSRLAASRFDPSRIPGGMYCYSHLSPMDENGRMKVNGLCPYWERRGGYSAFCNFLQEEDEIVLWDQVKICGVNEEMDDA